MADETTDLTTQDENLDAGGKEAAAPATQTDSQKTTAEYDFGKFQQAIKDGKISTDVLDEIYADVPGWLGNINKRYKQAADEKNKAAALRAQLEKQVAGGNVQQIAKPEDHLEYQAAQKLAARLVASKAWGQADADAFLADQLLAAQGEVEKSNYIRKEDLQTFLSQSAKDQQEGQMLVQAAAQLKGKYKSIDDDVAGNLIAAFTNNDETPDIGLRKTIAFIESIRTAALKEEKPKPKTTIVVPGAAPIFAAKQNELDKEIAAKQAELTRKHMG